MRDNLVDVAAGLTLRSLEGVQAYAAWFDYDVEAMFRDLRARQEASGRDYVRLPARRPVSAAQDRATP